MKKLLAIVGALILIVLFFSGCSDSNTVCNVEKNQPTSVCVLIQKTRNNAQANLGAEMLNNDIQAVLEIDGSKLIAVELDGAPYTVFNSNIKVDKTLSSSLRNQDAQKVVSNMAAKLKEAVPLTNEVDVLEGLILSTRELNASDSINNDRILYVCSNGLQTTGLINMSDMNIIDADPQLLAEEIKDNLPNMQGIRVFWLGLGDTADEQKKLDESNKRKLEKIYKAIIEAAGGTVEFFNDTTTSQDNPIEWPSVKEVAIINTTVDENVINIIKLDNEKISFDKGKGEIKNRENAIEALKPIADYLIKNPKESIVMGASTASWGSTEYCNDLSKKRNASVVELLVELGVKENQIKTKVIGRDKNCKLRVNDLDKNGELNDNADKNRAVFILSEEEAKKYF